MTTTKNNNLATLFGGDGNKNFYSDKPLSKMHEFYLSDTIGKSDEYIDWFEIIRNCGEHDVVKIHINSYGGDLFTAIQMLRAINDCPGTVITSVEGACMSAATMIFLTSDAYEVSPHSMFMFHNYSGGTIGKGGEMFEQLKHERSWSEKLMREIYVDFLTEEEIQSMLDNKDIWMDADEVVERLNIKAERMAEATETAMEDAAEEIAAESEEQPKKKRTRKKKTSDAE